MFSLNDSFKQTFCLLSIVALSACATKFVNKVELTKLKKTYNGIYITLRPVDIGNNRKAKVGIKVKLYFITTSESIKVYAYSHQESRETTLGENILYLFEDDFPDDQWDATIFEKKLLKIVKKMSSSGRIKRKKR